MGAYGMSGTNPVGDNGKASADADGTHGYVDADVTGEYKVCGCGCYGRVRYVGTDAIVGRVMQART